MRIFLDGILVIQEHVINMVIGEVILGSLELYSSRRSESEVAHSTSPTDPSLPRGSVDPMPRYRKPTESSTEQNSEHPHSETAVCSFLEEGQPMEVLMVVMTTKL